MLDAAEAVDGSSTVDGDAALGGGTAPFPIRGTELVGEPLSGGALGTFDGCRSHPTFPSKRQSETVQRLDPFEPTG